MGNSGFLPTLAPMAEPDTPQPTPFPIRIVTEPPPPADLIGLPRLDTSKKNDFFYEAWDRFLALEPKRAKKTSALAKKIVEEKRGIEQKSGEGLSTKQNAATSWQEAADDCKAKVAAIVDECERLNRKYVDHAFDLEGGPYCLVNLEGQFPKAIGKIDPPTWIKRIEDVFEKPQFFIDGANATDVHQGSAGDCWFLAALMAISAKKELIENLCIARNEKIGVYGFVFYRDGEWISEVIDDKLYLNVGDDDKLSIVRDWSRSKKEGRYVYYEEDKLKELLQRGGEALFFSHCKSNETWLPLIEKAYAKAHGDYFSIEGGYASEGIEDLTGGVGVVINPEDIMDKNRFWKDQLSQVNEKYLFGGGSKAKGSKGVIGGHAYAVMKAYEEGDLRLLKLRNPWGDTEWEGDWSDGSKLWTAEMMTKLGHTFGDDGVFWMSYTDFLKHFPNINRVRLFDKSWQVSQQWTCVKVPWTVDYLDTKFEFTITEKGPVVIALCQPDDRYFKGLDGRFWYSLHFRVYKNGEEEGRWIVRSMHNSGSASEITRSVSAEIENLDRGTYSVVFKVSATRWTGSMTAETNINLFAADRKEKLLNVGRRFDYAQAKGNLRPAEDAVRRQQRRDTNTESNDALKKARRLKKQENERERLRKERLDKVTKQRKREYEMAVRKRAKTKKDVKKAKEAAKKASRGKKIEREPIIVVEVKGSETNSTAVNTPASSTDDNAAKSDETIFSAEDSKSDDVTAIATKKDIAPETVENKKVESVADILAKIEITTPSKAASDDNEQNDDEESDEAYETPLDEPQEVTNDDFEWDSDIDAPVVEDSDEDETQQQQNDTIFGTDPWNALCVLGLRVYSQNSEAKIRVVKGNETA
ncbi:hypothetical protein LTR86_006918 [Recurvomyces mirabilis]|nr:hypothetical protein LTR86_006918 [Recurvomyces mirabilis]